MEYLKNSSKLSGAILSIAGFGGCFMVLLVVLQNELVSIGRYSSEGVAAITMFFFVVGIYGLYKIGGSVINRIKTDQEGDRLSQKSIDSAVAEIETHGMKAHFYLAAVGNRNNSDLSHALDTLEAAGFIITDSNDQLVGKVATRTPGSNELAEQRRATFKIV